MREVGGVKGGWLGFVFPGLVAGGEIGIGGGEGGEVVRAEDVRGGLLERGKGKVERACPKEGGEHRGADTVAGEDAVLVGFAEGAVAGVEVGWNSFDRENADAGWEGPVEGMVEIG